MAKIKRTDNGQKKKDNQALMYYAATATDPKISRPIYKADGTVEGYMTSIVSTKWLKGNKTLMNKALSLFVLFD
jgi:hypothetical protein